MISSEVDEVCSYDDLSVAISPEGRVGLTCPTCGLLPIPRRGIMLSDLTNAGLEHLLEVHRDTFTLVLGQPAANRTNT